MDPRGSTTLATMFDAAVMRHADRPMLRIDDQTLTFAEFGDRVATIASALDWRGVTMGSRVGLSAANSVEFAAVLFAAIKLGASVVMISTSWRDREVGHAVELTDPSHLLHDGSGAVALADTYPDRIVIDIAELADAVSSSPPPTATVGHSAEAVLVFHSGTTGLPKAVRHTHDSISHAIHHWVEALGLGANDRLQITTPPFHILGLLNLFVVAATGASVRLHRRFDLDAMLEAIESDRITIEMAVAPIALAMANHLNLERFDLSSLRYIMWGATPVTPSVAETVTRRSGVPFLPAYGASELPVMACNPVYRPELWRLDSVGLPPDGVALRVVDLETGQEAEPCTPGEIQGRSQSVMSGYLPDDSNNDAFVDGWYRTGDVGTIDAQGWVTITDRVKEMIKVKGFQVAPAEVEAVLLDHPEVIDCAVFGIPDAAAGEAVAAAVVLASSATVDADALKAIVADQLAAYKQVSELQVVNEIPRLPSGKVLRRQLQAEHAC